nr:SET domain-containing protein-lysine N-methyltransferase [uncultured Campylobacter sp.]
MGFLDGQVMPWAQYNEIMKNTDLGYFNSYIFMEWNALDKNTLLVRAFRTKYSYINHSRKPNVAIKYNPMRVEAIKDITKNNEILIDYRKEPLNDNYIKNYGKEFL